MTDCTHIGYTWHERRDKRNVVFRSANIKHLRQGFVGGVGEVLHEARVHSALKYLRLVDYYRGNPEALLAERKLTRR